MPSDQTRQLALALLEIRTLLADHLGGDVEAPMNIRIAAHIAYALHNEAEAAYNNADFELGDATCKIAAIDQILGVTDGATLVRRFSAEVGGVLESDQPE